MEDILFAVVATSLAWILLGAMLQKQFNETARLLTLKDVSQKILDYALKLRDEKAEDAVARLGKIDACVYISQEVKKLADSV